MKKQELTAKISALKSEVALAEAELFAFDSSLGQNQYANHSDAEKCIADRHEEIASEDCEGAYNCGQSDYTQIYQIIGNTNKFEATTSFEYNRHDKTYYYIERQSYNYKQLEPAAVEVKS